MASLVIRSTSASDAIVYERPVAGCRHTLKLLMTDPISCCFNILRWLIYPLTLTTVLFLCCAALVENITVIYSCNQTYVAWKCLNCPLSNRSLPLLCPHFGEVGLDLGLITGAVTLFCASLSILGCLFIIVTYFDSTQRDLFLSKLVASMATVDLLWALQFVVAATFTLTTQTASFSECLTLSFWGMVCGLCSVGLRLVLTVVLGLLINRYLPTWASVECILTNIDEHFVWVFFSPTIITLSFLALPCFIG
jgi:hypothetical protein